MSTGDWIALTSVAVAMLGIIAGGFYALSHRMDAQDSRIATLAAQVMQLFRNGHGHD